MQSTVKDRKEWHVKQSRLEKQNNFFYIPVLRTLLTAGGVVLIESPDRPCSISVVPGGDKDGGFTEDSWTFQNKNKERKKKTHSDLVKRKYKNWLSSALYIFLIIYYLSEVFTGHSAFRHSFLILTHTKDQALQTLAHSVASFLDTWHLTCHTPCSSYFHTRRRFYSLLFPDHPKITLLNPCNITAFLFSEFSACFCF